MYQSNQLNLVLSGCGVRGIAYIGMYDVASQKGFRFKNIAGVSAGALVGSLIASRYTASSLAKLVWSF